LYTHKRNKHNIIPITNKQDIFKAKDECQNKFKYSAFDNNTNINGIAIGLKEKYIEICEAYYSDESSMFYNPRYNLTNDPFISLLDVYINNNLGQISIPNKNNKKLIFIDNILLVYSILLLEVTRDCFFLDRLVKFIFLLRNYLNLVGWEHNKYLHSYGLLNEFTKTGEYCSKNTTEQIPELINNFVAVFVYMEGSFGTNAKEYIDLAENLCYWLYINSFSHYKIFKNEGI
jgi:hypothetical protein